MAKRRRRNPYRHDEPDVGRAGSIGAAMSSVFGQPWHQLSTDEVVALMEDVSELADDEFDGEDYDAAVELRRRIGGKENLASYVKSLVAGRRRRQGNPRRTRRPKVWAGERDEFFTEVWEERDRLHIALYFDPVAARKRERFPGDGDLVAEWWDDDARQMFEDGFFESGRKLEESVVKYAEHIGLVRLT